MNVVLIIIILYFMYYYYFEILILFRHIYLFCQLEANKSQRSLSSWSVDLNIKSSKSIFFCSKKVLLQICV